MDVDSPSPKTVYEEPRKATVYSPGGSTKRTLYGATWEEVFQIEVLEKTAFLDEFAIGCLVDEVCVYQSKKK